MFGLSVKLPITEELQAWTDEAFIRLSAMLGRERMLNARVILPTDEFFPDTYDGSLASLTAMARRVAGYMGLGPDTFKLEVFAEEEQALRATIPFWSGKTKDAAGLYFHQPEDGKFPVALHAKQLRDPLAVVGTLAHELAHVLLLGGGLLDPQAEDMEPLTDVCTVFVGLGFFTASSSFQFRQWTEDRMQGWSTQRKGYLPEPLWGYALARFAKERDEQRPQWVNALPHNIRVYFKQSAKWLERH